MVCSIIAILSTQNIGFTLKNVECLITINTMCMIFFNVYDFYYDEWNHINGSNFKYTWIIFKQTSISADVSDYDTFYMMFILLPNIIEI